MSFAQSDTGGPEPPGRKRRLPGTWRHPGEGSLSDVVVTGRKLQLVAEPEAPGKCFRCQLLAFVRRTLTATFAQALANVLQRSLRGTTRSSWTPTAARCAPWPLPSERPAAAGGQEGKVSLCRES
jgi:hypothetical protein